MSPCSGLVASSKSSVCSFVFHTVPPPAKRIDCTGVEEKLPSEYNSFAKTFKLQTRATENQTEPTVSTKTNS